MNRTDAENWNDLVLAQFAAREGEDASPTAAGQRLVAFVRDAVRAHLSRVRFLPGPVAEADDLTQRVLVVVARRAGEWKGLTPDAFAAVLHGTIRNVTGDALRAFVRHRTVGPQETTGAIDDVPDPSTPAPDDHYEALREALGRVGDQLSPDEQELLVLRFWLGMTVPEIADFKASAAPPDEARKWTRAATAQRLHRLLDDLRGRLGGGPPNPVPGL